MKVIIKKMNAGGLSYAHKFTLPQIDKPVTYGPRSYNTSSSGN